MKVFFKVWHPLRIFQSLIFRKKFFLPEKWMKLHKTFRICCWDHGKHNKNLKKIAGDRKKLHFGLNQKCELFLFVTVSLWLLKRRYYFVEDKSRWILRLKDNTEPKFVKISWKKYVPRKSKRSYHYKKSKAILVSSQGWFLESVERTWWSWFGLKNSFVWVKSILSVLAKIHILNRNYAIMLSKFCGKIFFDLLAPEAPIP